MNTEFLHKTHYGYITADYRFDIVRLKPGYRLEDRWSVRSNRNFDLLRDLRRHLWESRDEMSKEEKARIIELNTTEQ